MKFFNKKNWVLAPLIVFGLLVHRHWLTFTAYATTDWPHYPVFTQLHKLVPSAWVSFYNVGTPASMLWRWPYEFLYGVFAYFGFASNIAHPFLTFLPIVLTLTIGGYLLVKKITGSTAGAAVGSLIITYNTYNLASYTEGHFLLPLAAGYAVLALWLYFVGVDKMQYSHMVLSGLLLSMAGYTDFRMAYIMVWVILFYIVFDIFIIRQVRGRKEVLHRVLILITPLVLLAFLHFFWVLTAYNMGSLTENHHLSRNVFGDEFWSLLAAFALFHPFWTGGDTLWFSLQTIPWYFWIAPVASFCGFWVRRTQPRVVFFYAIALIGIFLAKQRDVPWGEVYSFLFDHLPGFSAFREATKFYFLISMGYAVLVGSFIGHLLTGVTKGKYKKMYVYGVIGVIALPFVWNAKPIFNNEAWWMQNPRGVIPGYEQFNATVHNHEDFFRVIEIPFSSGQLANAIHHPTVFADDLDFIFGGRAALKRGYESSAAKLAIESLFPFAREDADEILDASSVRYVVVVPQYNADGADVYAYRNIDRQFFLHSLDLHPYLKRIDFPGTDLVVYENEGARPRLSVTDVNGEHLPDESYAVAEASKLYMVKSEVDLSNLDEEVLLHLSEQYHSQWRMRVGDFNWFSALLQKDYFLSDSFHLEDEHEFNSFLLSAETVRAHADAAQYEENENGSMNVRVTLYFFPQSILYLGMIVSGTVAAGSVGYVLYAWHRRRKKRIDET